MIQDIKDSILERVTSPLLGAFISFWLICNWKGMFFVLFETDLSIAERLFVYETTLFSYEKALYWPAFYTLLFLVLYPLVAIGAFRVWRWADQQRRNYSLKVSRRSPVDGVVHAELKEKYEKVKVDHYAEIGALKAEHESLMQKFAEENAELSGTIKSSAAQNEALRKQIEGAFIKNSDLEKEVANSRQVIENEKAKLAEAFSDIERYRKEISELKATCEEASVGITDFMIENNNLKGELEKAKSSMVNTQEIKLLNERINALAQNIYTLDHESSLSGNANPKLNKAKKDITLIEEIVSGLLYALESGKKENSTRRKLHGSALRTVINQNMDDN